MNSLVSSVITLRRQISREGFWIGQCHVLAEELQLSGANSMCTTAASSVAITVMARA